MSLFRQQLHEVSSGDVETAELLKLPTKPEGKLKVVTQVSINAKWLFDNFCVLGNCSLNIKRESAMINARTVYDVLFLLHVVGQKILLYDQITSTFSASSNGTIFYNNIDHTTNKKSYRYLLMTKNLI